ncbi:hypothetical protein BOX17_13035 [Halomonas aestuarii]|uniref:Uncharacterized protein n=1 Tax=Halomonas aestuarii TaxID=1897729 RepID=A0A1J0VIF3_9GAMM|nr:hypothetical protein [Halomonas aestuarii]APE31794.1 hypothetical protein BOX17_13035 [Halomonas aestuarii]
MTHRTTASHDPAATADDTVRRHRLAALLAQDDIVRPELRNAAILQAQRAPSGASQAGRPHHPPARRS